MISGIKISQLPVFESLQDTDYYVVRRGNTTAQTSHLTLFSSITAQNTGSGYDILSDSLTNGALISVKRLSAVGDFLTIDSTTTNLVLSSTIPTASITDSMIHAISGVGKIYPESINTDNSLSGQVLFSRGPGLSAVWKDVPMDASSGNIANKVVARDLSGNFYATTVIANLSGNANTSTRWLSGRTITLSGMVLGTTTIDGTQNVTISTTISADTIYDIHIANNAGISDIKLNTITTPKKVSPNSIDYTGTQTGDVLTSTGSATIWQSASALSIFIPDSSITTPKIAFEAVTSQKIGVDAVTTSKLSGLAVTTSKIADEAVTTSKLANGAVTLAKTAATPTALSGTLVSRDNRGNLSAVEVTANLKGNATTATRWASPMSLVLGGDVNGSASFDGGTQTTILSTNLSVPVPSWVTFDATSTNRQLLSATFIQSNGSNGPGTDVTVFQTVTGLRVTTLLGVFTQDSELIDITLPLINQSILLTPENIQTFLTYNLLTGTILTAAGFDIEDGPYTILISEYNSGNESIFIQLSTTDIKVTTEPITVTFDETFFFPTHNHIIGHAINPEFITGASLDANPYTAEASGIRFVTDVLTPYSFTLSTNTVQYASGTLILHRCDVDSNYDVPVVTYIDTGNFILNFSVPFDNPFYYGFTGSAVTLSTTPTMNSVERVIYDYQDTLNLQIRTLINDGTISHYNFKRNHIMCFGNKQS
jgi:hypothetical protein